jgi:hypothetical protein
MLRAILITALVLLGAVAARADECTTIDDVKARVAAAGEGSVIVLSDADNAAIRDSVAQVSAMVFEPTDTFIVVFQPSNPVATLIWMHGGCFHRYRLISVDELNAMLPGEVAG